MIYDEGISKYILDSKRGLGIHRAEEEQKRNMDNHAE